MASLKRSKTMPADGQTAKFLYTILKQLDLKSIDWNLVASQLEISNGHAARMRFSRFRQHMEGITTNNRTPRPKNKNVDKAHLKKNRFSEAKPEPMLKTEHTVKQEQDMDLQPANAKFMPVDMTLKPPPPVQQPYLVTTVAPADLALSFPSSHPVAGFPSRPPTVKEWSRIKIETCEGAATTRPDGLVKRE
ncbi:conserved hypothetical protein [Histoplasma capsulatum G186AR]|uniref:Myb-like DNA-binding domain-containing protein n=2 Tax=Ajellomyces capsulatus TaxID=5037 RepID=C0P055_AJECG|nr:uncharacterized protein HCBG_08774 [Histoplasma capsulatum G186AR]EEH02871.1 conserved hypothetical protein [Histoplasma capsulatum G186AR]KAG5295944.1 hypothetical protein I7I52_06395 [Histoplasma capsulatum]QSS73927.1 hypothetical protein I7I50_08879 [Histoplasma capsulatum G186AR]